MREVYKNPMLYYVAIPVLVGLWPLLVWAYYLPRAEHSRDVEGGLCVQGQTDVIEILKIDPDRLNPGKGQVTTEFSYVGAVERVGNLCKMPATSVAYSAGQTQTLTGGKKRQDARITLTNVSITKPAMFLYTIQSMWTLLNCESLNLTKQKGMPDQWNAEFRFLYYY